MSELGYIFGYVLIFAQIIPAIFLVKMILNTGKKNIRRRPAESVDYAELERIVEGNKMIELLERV